MNETFDRFGRMEDKLDHIVDRIGSIDVTLAAQHVSLKEHMRRTELLEGQMAPLQKTASMVHGVLKLIGLLALVATICEGALQVLQFIRK